jgi:hypothetical protein
MIRQWVEEIGNSDHFPIFLDLSFLLPNLLPLLNSILLGSKIPLSAICLKKLGFTLTQCRRG